MMRVTTALFSRFGLALQKMAAAPREPSVTYAPFYKEGKQILLVSFFFFFQSFLLVFTVTSDL